MKMPKLYMYSRLNVLVNEINSLGIKQIEETELNRKILHSLRRADYELVTSTLYEKELKTMTPNQLPMSFAMTSSQKHHILH
jgi:hypothetical protein